MDHLLADGGGGLAENGLLGRLAALADAALDQVVIYHHDRAGRLVKQVDGEGGFTDNLYNAYGELAAQLRATREGRTTTRQLDYDLLGRGVSPTLESGGHHATTPTASHTYHTRTASCRDNCLL